MMMATITIVFLWRYDVEDYDDDYYYKHHHLFLKEKAINAWEMQAPMLVILVFNTFFLIWVIAVIMNPWSHIDPVNPVFLLLKCLRYNHH